MTRPNPLAIIAYAAPGILALISLAAALSMGKDRLPGWLAVVLMVGLLAWVGYAFSRGLRRLPAWQVIGSFPLVVAGGALLEHSDRLWPLTLAAAGLLGWSLHRAPAAAGPQDRMIGPAELQDRMIGPAGPVQGSVRDGAVRGAASGLAPGPQDMSPGAVGRVRLAGAGTVAMLLIVGAGTLALGGCSLYSAITGRNYVPDTTAVRVLGGFFGVVFSLMGLAGLVTAGELLASKDQLIEADPIELRRTGIRSWSVPWTTVRSAGLTVRHRPGWRAARQSVTIWIELAPGRPAGHLRADDRRPPYTHSDRLPEQSLTEVDRLLSAYAGGRYRGVVEG